MLAGPAIGRIGPPLAFALTAATLLLPATVAPLFRVSDYGAHREGLLVSSAAALWRDGFPSLGTLVALFAIVLPLLFLTLLIWVLATLLMDRRAALGPVFRWVQHLQPWVMIEVYLMGGFVAYNRIKVVANVELRQWEKTIICPN